METGNGIFSNVPNPEWDITVFHEFPALPTEGIIYKLLLNIEGNDIQQEVKKALTTDTYMTVAEGKLIQIMSTAATKWNGIKTMLEAVSVAVSNAIDEVLHVADFITESNDMDGVAQYIERNIL